MANQTPRQQTPVVGGPIHSVPCPHCGAPNDLRELQGQNLLDTGHNIICASVDGNRNQRHCGRVFQVTRIQPIVYVQVRQMHQVYMALHPGSATQQALPRGQRPPQRRVVRRLPGR